MEIWLKGYKNFRIPVLPSEYSVRSERGDETVVINSIGEVDLGGKMKLKSISFSSFFPSDNESYVSYDCPTPRECVEIIEKMQQGSPCKLTITGVPIKMYCRISSFTWEEHDGTGDIYYSLTLTEHKKISIERSSVVVDKTLTTPPVVESVREDPPKETIQYTVKSGESASSIARKTTGKASNKTKIAQQNGLGTPPIVDPGLRLVINEAAATSTLTLKKGRYGGTTTHVSANGRSHSSSGRSFGRTSLSSLNITH